MRYFGLMFLCFLVVSCQDKQPSELEQYQEAKLTDHQLLEADFAQQITEQITASSNDQTFPISNQEIAALKETLLALNSQNKKEKTENSLTPSTSNEEIEALDSLVGSQETATTPMVDKTQNGGLLISVRNYDDAYQKVQSLSDKHQFNIVSQEEHNTDFHKANTIKIYAPSAAFDAVVDDFRNLATVIRQKQIWQKQNTFNLSEVQSQLVTGKNYVQQLSEQLSATNTLSDKLLIQAKIAEAKEALDLLVLNTKTAISNKPYSVITLTFYESLELGKPAPTAFSADFSSNLVIGWVNFKQFVLDAALVWPYIIIGLIFLITILLAVNSSRKKTRQFKLQMLHGQNLQQQITQYKTNKN